jgi:hypothetical protein
VILRDSMSIAQAVRVRAVGEDFDNVAVAAAHVIIDPGIDAETGITPLMRTILAERFDIRHTDHPVRTRALRRGGRSAPIPLRPQIPIRNESLRLGPL